MGFMQRLIGRFEETPLDIKVREKTLELQEKSERLSVSVRQKLSEPPDALDLAIDEDRVKQELKPGPLVVLDNSKMQIVAPALQKDVKEMHVDVKVIRSDVTDLKEQTAEAVKKGVKKGIRESKK